MADIDPQRDVYARPARRPALVAVPLALAATASAVTLGVVLQGAGDPAADVAAKGESATQSAAPAQPAPRADLIAGVEPDGELTRPPILSRSQDRSRSVVPTVEKAPNLTSEVRTRAAIREAKAADTQLWVTDELNLWVKPGAEAAQDGVLEAGRQILVTGRAIWGRSEVVYQGRSYWVTDGYLSKDEPVGANAVVSEAPCAAGSAIEGGLTSGAVTVYRAICNAFPQITTYGGRDNHGEHVTGKAIDAMTSDIEVGTAVAEFLRAHAAEFNIYDIIWRQRIFTSERAGEGWRGMPSRGSATADHYDHVHVAVY